MEPSQTCYDLIKSMEGCNLNAYVDPGTGNLPITIGYGATMRKDGSRFKLGDIITQHEADELLEWEINTKGIIVSHLLSNVPITQNQYDSVVSLIYNIGAGNFRSSTLYKKIKVNPNDITIPAEFSRWNKAAGKVMKGLTTRRKAESDLYVT